MTRPLALLAILLLVITGCKSYGPALNVAENNGSHVLPTSSFLVLNETNALPAEWLQPPSEFFRLGPGDVIEIEVLGDAISSAEARVGPDGRIYYSILPGTMVWGLTLSDTKGVLEESLAQNLRVKPELAVSLKAANSPRVWLLGNIDRPGVYTLSTPTTILDLLSTAGGVSARANDLGDLGRSFVMRGGNVLDVNFFRLVRQGDLSQNIYLQPGDYIYVGSAFSKEIYILGAVATPSAMQWSEDLSLLAAVARSGGPAPYAHMSEVLLIRGSLSSPRVATVNFHDIRKGKALDVRLEAGDIIYVPFSAFRKVEQLADQVLSQFVRTLAINEGRTAVLRGGQPVGVTVPVGP